jgi:hypothetical protein
MVQILREQGVDPERLLAELTEAAYHVALRHGVRGPFLDMELDLWRELRRVLSERQETTT